MLVVKVEVWPFGHQEHAKEIGRAYIWNDATGDIMHGNYGVAIMPDTRDYLPTREILEREAASKGKVFNYPRGPYNLWPLVRDALKACRIRKKKALPLSHGHNGMVKKDAA